MTATLTKKIRRDGNLEIQFHGKNPADGTTLGEFLSGFLEEHKLSWINPRSTGDTTRALIVGTLGGTRPHKEGSGFEKTGFWDSKYWAKPVLERWIFPPGSPSSILNKLLTEKKLTLSGGTLLQEEYVEAWGEKTKKKPYDLSWIIESLSPEEQTQLLDLLHKSFEVPGNPGEPIRFKLEKTSTYPKKGRLLILSYQDHIERNAEETEKIWDEVCLFLIGYNFGKNNRAWLPIKKAPKDQVILVNDTTGAAPWAAARWVETTEWSGWIYDDEAASDNNPTGPKPTHYFPVPPIEKTNT